MSSFGKTIPKVIQKLDERVVNRISAGEVIHRPVNVVKELIENCLDANSTLIEVVVKDGGMQLIVIEDNGTGIRKEDLDIVCERFTTSKLEVFEDLEHIQTYGFRGEALAAISHISYVEISTKTLEQLCGFRLEFIDGKPISSARPVAKNNGTVIRVEKLFYNLLNRKNALNCYSVEYNLILELITKYAIHNSNRVSFSLKKLAENCDLNTNIENKIIENIRALYGTNIANNLIEISIPFEDQNRLKFSLKGLISNQNVSQKNFVFILFINDRLVDCPSLRKAIDLVYSNYLLKGFHSFVYLSIKIESKNIDVNVDPTKSEVHFLHEQEICEIIVELVERNVSFGETRRLKEVENVLNRNKGFESYDSVEEEAEELQKSTKREKPKIGFQDNCQKSRKELKEFPKQSTPIRPEKQIRTDSRVRKIDEFLLTSNRIGKNRNRREIKLKSVSDLRQLVANDTDSALEDMIMKSSYVGCVDETYILLQHETQLLLVNAINLNRELFYQLFLIDFGNFSRIKFSKPLLIRDLVKPYLEECSSPLSPTSGVTQIETILMEKREMLSDYFSIDISDQKELLSLPKLLDPFVPNFENLPKFLNSLANDVNWNTEKECFESIGSVLAQFYSKPLNSDHQNWAKIVETIVYPTYKAVLCPSKTLSNNSTFFVTTNLSDLYKVFERC